MKTETANLSAAGKLANNVIIAIQTLKNATRTLSLTELTAGMANDPEFVGHFWDAKDAVNHAKACGLIKVRRNRFTAAL